MSNVLTVCKNVIASNNKSKWSNPTPPIRIAKTKSGKVQDRAFFINIHDKQGNIVATLESTKDGNPIVKCGAKVAIFTKYPISTKN